MAVDPEFLCQQSQAQRSTITVSSTSLLISFITSLILIIFFLIIRLVFKKLYGSNVYSTSFWGWIYPVIFRSDREILRSHGLDATVYLVFSRAILHVSLLLLLITILIFAPVYIDDSLRHSRSFKSLLFHTRCDYLYGSDQSESSDTASTSRLYILFLSLLLNSSLCYSYLVKVYLQYGRLKHEFMEYYPSNCTNVVRGIQTCISETEIKKIYEKLFPNQVLRVYRVANTLALSSAISKYNRLIEKVERQEIKFHNGVDKLSQFTWFRSYKKWALNRIQKRLFEYRKQLVSLNHKINSLRSNMTYTGIVFVTFKQHSPAIMCRRLNIRLDGVLCSSSPAPDIRDIRWNSFSYTNLHRFLHRGITFGLVSTCCLLWSFVVTFAQGLNNLGRLLELDAFSWLRFLYEKYPSQLKNIFELIPSLFLFSLLSLLRYLLQIVVRFELPLTRTSKERSYTSKLYYILIINVFLGSVAAGSVISITGMQSIAERPIDTIRQLGLSVPAQAGFFINYFVINSVLWNISIVIQPVRLMKWIYYNYINTTETPQRTKWLKSLPRFYFYIEYSEQLLYFSILITFCSLAPIITPFGVLYFGSKWIASRYFILFLHCKRYEGFASAWPDVFNCACLSILIYQIIIAGYFMLFSELTMVIMTFLFAVFTIFYRWLVNRIASSMISSNHIDFYGGTMIEPQPNHSEPYEYKIPDCKSLSSRHQELV
ncbi:uncharacterized protein LOC126325939 [Schistocerca gregaria]|uniref:uncharacterized protein LOC126325939 n=1 Tax=Schistocerca gregaria TaxID=7010 RepID=UPI00211EF1D5|nr:uncharacterized protein LOC126325939 [Schistocerca gregaria]XP_049851397.1 uncharacterized protein LOC126325939 [Schistocerca gregaria]